MVTVIATIFKKATGAVVKCGKVCYAGGALTIDKLIDIVLKFMGVA